MRAVADPVLDEILASVSRSFYLSLTILPRAVRPQIAVAYLLARAADTLADTPIVPAARRCELLADLRGAIVHAAEGAPDADRVPAALAHALPGLTAPGSTAPGSTENDGGRVKPAERALLGRVGECLGLLARQDAGDRQRAHRVLDALVGGMERDLARFPDDGAAREPPRALATMDDLDDHTYRAAGCVGEYWTEMIAAHVPAARHLGAPDPIERGVRLGKALQLVNVIRDAPADLAAGRCYLPVELLARHGLAPGDLRSARRLGARPVVDALVRLALEHVDAAWPYVMAIPARAPRLRLACIWPLWIGLETLARLAACPDPLAPGTVVKIARRDVWHIVAASTSAVCFDGLLDAAHARRRRAITLRGDAPLSASSGG